MKDCTRSSHSFCLDDRSKSMGRSSVSLCELFCAGLSSRFARPASAIRLDTDAKARNLAAHRGAIPSCGLTFPDLQTIVSYNCLNCNSLTEGSYGQRSDPDIDSRRRRTALRRSGL